MTLTQKIIVFWVCVLFIRVCIEVLPETWLTRILNSWHGPIPRVDETESAFFLRYAFWASNWLLQTLLLTIAGVYFFAAYSSDSLFVAALFEFALPFLALLALAGSGILFVKSLSCRLSKNKKTFRIPPGAFLAEQDD